MTIAEAFGELAHAEHRLRHEGYTDAVLNDLSAAQANLVAAAKRDALEEARREALTIGAARHLAYNDVAKETADHIAQRIQVLAAQVKP